jgi:hypothetical protein
VPGLPARFGVRLDDPSEVDDESQPVDGLVDGAFDDVDRPKCLLADAHLIAGGADCESVVVGGCDSVSKRCDEAVRADAVEYPCRHGVGRGRFESRLRVAAAFDELAEAI